MKRAVDPAVHILAANRTALLKLEAATTIDRFWMATQILITGAAPCSSRWLCLRPIRMTTAMMLLRETPPARGRKRSHRTTKGRLEAEEEGALLKELFARHPAVSHFRRNSGAPLVHLRPRVIRKVRRGVHDLLRGCDWVFGAALAFWSRKRMQGLLLLHRTAKEGDFSRTELRNLRQLHPHLETALSRVIAVRRQHAQKNLLEEILKPLPLPLVLCDWRLNIICESAAGHAARAIWDLGRDAARSLKHSRGRPLPADLTEFCRSQVEAWVKAEPPKRVALEKEEHELAHRSVPQLRANVQMVRQRKFPLVKPLFLLRFESASSHRNLVGTEHATADKFPLLAKLSPRERELALLVCEGYSNARVARQLGKSGGTIKAQLHSVFEKLHVKSRSRLVALLMRPSVHLVAWSSAGTVDAVLAGI